MSEFYDETLDSNKDIKKQQRLQNIPSKTEIVVEYDITI